MLELLGAKGHGTDSLLGGGLTLHGQVPDVVVHPHLELKCRADELEGSLDFRIKPPCGKQTVLNRGQRAYVRTMRVTTL